MGLNPHDADPDLLAAYAIDAVDEPDVLLVEAGLATSADASGTEQVLRQAGGAYAAAVTDPTLPSPGLRSRVLAAAFAARPATGPAVRTTAAQTFQVESERFLATVSRLTPEQWAAPVDPPEFEGWTVGDIVAHVTSNQSLFAQLLDVADPLVPEDDNSNDVRTAAVQARHRTMAIADVCAEYRRSTERIVALVEGRPDLDLEEEVSFWGNSMRISTVLLHRSFETWIHHDDLRRAAGLPELAAPAPSLAAMSTRASEWGPLFLMSVGANVEGEVAVIDLTGEGGGLHTLQLGLDPVAPADAGDPRFAIEVDVVDFCRAIGRRIDPADLPYRADGDLDLAATFVAALPALASL